ncbi:mitochondrial 54S ribosomal protein YmL16 [Morchella snyderi]|nr:mitochondrial 54S ribosomal protein YmL16 [Morchella snyderi]
MLPLLRHGAPRHAAAAAHRTFTTTAQRPSKIGMLPVVIPAEVELTRLPPPKPTNPRDRPIGSLVVKGPLGTLTLPLPPYLTLTTEPIPATTSTRATISVADPAQREQREMWGTTRSVLQNLVLGVTEGHSVILRLVGVGYRATVETAGGRALLNLKVGYSHPVELPVPDGVRCAVPMPTRILLEGCDKVKIGDFAAAVREWRRPEPYKGKGIFVGDETIKLKVKKVK